MKAPQQLIDFTNAEIFYHKGKDLNISITERVNQILHLAYTNTLAALGNEIIGLDSQEVTLMLLNLLADESSLTAKAMYIKELVKKANKLGKEITDLRDIANNLQPDTNYALTLGQLQQYGLSYVQS